MQSETTCINRLALFASGMEDYRIPPEPDPGQTVTLRFRTSARNVDYVYFIDQTTGNETEMRLEKRESVFDYYVCRIRLGEQKLCYYFKIVKGDEICCYNTLGVTEDLQMQYAFRITPGFHTPDWAKGAVMYQIYVDRFCNGDKSNDVETGEYFYIGHPVKKIKKWDTLPSAMDVRHFYGGDLQGVWDKLDYLQSLGIEVLYLNPIFVSPSNHKYDIQDYEHVDPHFGVIVKDGGEVLIGEDTDNTNATKYITRVASKENLEASDAFFAEFTKEVHRRGMKIILDGVFNHCGSFNKWLDREGIYEDAEGYEKGAYVEKESPYHTFFHFHKRDDDAWPYNDSYDGWWGHDTLPKLNYEGSEKLEQYILDIARKWLSEPYCIDGWRLDVAADLGQTSEYNHKFWRKFRQAVKETNPEALILAEHYGSPSPWLEGDQWDTVMNYDAFMEPLTWFLTGMEKHSDSFNGYLHGNGEQFFNSMKYHMSRMQTNSLLVAMNELSNHDHSRFLTRTNHMVGRIGSAGAEAASRDINKGILREAALIQMTWPGAPTIYYGDEAGVCGWTDPDSRRTYPWGEEDLEMIEYHRYLTGLHKRLKVLKRGSVKELAYGHQFISYGRMLGRYKAVVAVNNIDEERTFEIPVWHLGITDEDALARVMLTTEKGYNVGCVETYTEKGILTITLPEYSSVLFITQGREFFGIAPGA